MQDGALQAEPVGLDKSSAVTSLADANALMVCRAEREALKPGQECMFFYTGMRTEVNSCGRTFPILQIVGYQTAANDVR
ncbi:hypothetical protein PO124_06495 [Bacillus licheniformis]|nr:hypothetical protein [Bacillus licheniformis]